MGGITSSATSYLTAIYPQGLDYHKLQWSGRSFIGNLSCLETLQIRDCTRLRRILGGLSSLKELVITECPNLVSLQGELKELCSLEILGYPKLVGFLEKSLG
ncbi:hypothetical protein SLEP1_g56632 [Rubroshorea leprosula]|uniref:Uncharacterized protein n=1 Tax=Rubroshorea leprosula TaxID=152421 RepID=A0AAV5MK94_9ROSI|nr:hypothetical protein SLEP1_g56632 [Rubroshorea leprosula]